MTIHANRRYLLAAAMATPLWANWPPVPPRMSGMQI